MDVVGIRDSGVGTRLPVSSPVTSPEPRVPTKLDAVAKEFEAVFLAQMLAPLFSSVSTPEIAGGGKSEDVWNSLLQESYAKAMAERGGFGLADHVKDSLIRLQSASALEERPQ